MVLMETIILWSIDYEKFLLLHNRKKYAKALANFNNAFQNYCDRYNAISTMFVDSIHLKEVYFRKEK